MDSRYIPNDDTGTDNNASQNPDIAQTFSQAELNALIRNLPKIFAELLGSCLKSKNLLEPGMSLSNHSNLLNIYISS